MELLYRTTVTARATKLRVALRSDKIQVFGVTNTKMTKCVRSDKIPCNWYDFLVTYVFTFPFTCDIGTNAAL